MSEAFQSVYTNGNSKYQAGQQNGHLNIEEVCCPGQSVLWKECCILSVYLMLYGEVFVAVLELLILAKTLIHHSKSHVKP